MVKNLLTNTGDACSIPGSGRSPGKANGNLLQYSCLGNPMDRGAWWAADHGVAKSQTQLNDFTFTFHFHALEKEMATHSSVLAWRISGTGAAVHGAAQSRTRLNDFTFTFHFHALEKEMAAHFSVLAWRIPPDRVAWRIAVHGVAKSRI